MGNFWLIGVLMLLPFLPCPLILLSAHRFWSFYTNTLFLIHLKKRLNLSHSRFISLSALSLKFSLASLIKDNKLIICSRLKEIVVLLIFTSSANFLSSQFLSIELKCSNKSKKLLSFSSAFFVLLH